MQARSVVDNVHWVGANDPDRTLFEELTPLPDGTSYNSYVVTGSKANALIDTADPSMADVFLARLESLNLSRLDYIVIHHAEQDHSGTLPRVLQRYPDATILATKKCLDMLATHLHVDHPHCQAVEDNQEVSLGDMTLQFLSTPWVHWPETMMTYLPQRKVLFSCDLFGSHMGTNDLFVVDEHRVVEAARRYYAEVMMPFRKQIAKYIARLDSLDIEYIAPSHGPVFCPPGLIVDLHRQWIDDEPSNTAVLAYVSMHGSTRRMADRLIEALTTRGVRVEHFDLAEVDWGRLSMSLIDARTLILGSPNILAGPHPKVVYAAVVANALRPKVQNVSVFGSSGWGGKTAEPLLQLLGSIKADVVDPVMAKGLPTDNDYAALDAMADDIARRHQSLQS